MNSQKKMVYMQKFLNPSHYRNNSGLTMFSKENFENMMMESMSKALTREECPVKEKHVRKLLIGTFQAGGDKFFWCHLPIERLKGNQIVCWKFCHILHKILRDGHRGAGQGFRDPGGRVNIDARQILLDCGNMWRHVKNGYGKLIHAYCTLLYNRIQFLSRHNRMPNDLKVSDEVLFHDIGESRDDSLFELSCDIFDALDDILKLQELVLTAVDLKKFNSMTSVGQCHLAPLLACIQDSSILYDYSVKILFKLHGVLQPEDLRGHAERFIKLHQSLKLFYVNTSNLQYFKTLIQIPHLTDKPPNFLVASELQQHVTPRVVMISNPERESPDQYSSNQSQSSSISNGQLLVNLNEETTNEDLESNVSQSVAYASVASNGSDSIDAMLNMPDALPEQSFIDHSALISKNEKLESKIQVLETTILSMSQEHEQEVSRLQAIRDELITKTRVMEEENVERVKLHETEVKKLKDEIANIKCQYNLMKNSIDKVREECKRAQHDNEISQGAMRKMVKDLSDLKAENALLKQRSSIAATPPPAPVVIPDQAQERQLEELKKKVDELSLQLDQRDSQCQEWVKEREVLLTTKVKLEHQLDANQEDLLVAEMNETDKIIKDATLKIEELIEKSRKFESGIKLQVNEKISEVCSNLMKAVRNLIVQSRLLQREVVGSDTAKTKSEDFYKRNSAWTEGLISAANVVAMAAQSLVGSADRAMSGQAKFSELAAAAHEVAAATTQLVVASRVKANKDSEKLKILTGVAKQVNQCTGQVVDTARVCAELIEQEVDKVDIGSLTLHQTKKLEMETQVRLLELEDKLSKERIKLGLLRRQHYEQEDAAIAAAAAASVATSGP